MSEKPTHIVIVDDRLWMSAGRDAVSFAVFFAMVGLGVFLQSSAMQWVGAMLWFLWIISKAASVEKRFKKTIPEARAYLDMLEGKRHE